MAVRKRILILGNTDYSGTYGDLIIDSGVWDDVESWSPRDYDILICVISTLNTDTISYNAWHCIVDNLTLETACHIAKHEGCAVILIGDAAGSDQAHGLRWAPEWLFGLRLKVDRSEGKAIKQIAPSGDIPEFVGLCKKYYYSIESASFLSDKAPHWLGQRFKENKARLNSAPLLFNRYDFMIVARFNYVLEGNMIGPFYLFPDLETDGSEVLKAILSDLLGLQLASREPGWAIEMVAPKQAQYDIQVAETLKLIEEAQGKVEALQAQRTDVRRFLKLLYGGDFELEVIVLEVLQFLGADVEPPIEKNKEDGWIEVTINGVKHYGVLEIKSTKGVGFSEEGRRQLAEWIYRSLESRHIAYRGIFIGNSQKDTALEERGNPFSNSWEVAAKLHKITAIKSSVLYEAYSAKVAGSFDHNTFWTKVFSTDGIIDVYESAVQ